MHPNLFNAFIQLNHILVSQHSIKNLHTNDDNILTLSKDYNKILVKETNINNEIILRCWNSDVYYNYKDYICSLDYFIDIPHDMIKINYLSINNDLYDIEQNNLLNKIDYIILKKNVIRYLVNIAIFNKIKKIVIDVHKNLYRYNNELKEEGFKVTHRICKHNPYYIQLEKVIDNGNN